MLSEDAPKKSYSCYYLMEKTLFIWLYKGMQYMLVTLYLALDWCEQLLFLGSEKYKLFIQDNWILVNHAGCSVRCGAPSAPVLIMSAGKIRLTDFQRLHINL